MERDKPGKHLGFGSGIHHCIGAPLARREMFWAFRALVDRVDDIRFIPGANDFKVAPNFSLRALQELHVEFDAKAAQDRINPADITAESKATEVEQP